MIKVNESYNDQHACSVIVFGKTADHKLYADKKYTEKLSKAIVEDLFRKGLLMVDDGTSLLRPVKMAGAKVTTVDGTTSVTGTEWSAEE